MGDVLHFCDIWLAPLQLCVKLFSLGGKKSVPSIDGLVWQEHTRPTGELFSHLLFIISVFHGSFVFSHMKLERMTFDHPVCEINMEEKTDLQLQRQHVQIKDTRKAESIRLRNRQT